jgi:hypothetical protein
VTPSAGPDATDGVGPPRWVRASIEVNEGRDPLGLQTTTIDRLMPRLLPGILELSRRARYFSFYAYLLDLYREQQRPANSAALSEFIKAREWDYGLAVLNCPRECGSSPVGAQKLRGVVGQQEPPYPRGQSVESPFGGFGLYYRTPLSQMGIVARRGTLLRDTPIGIDVLYQTERARHLADTFREAVEDTAYARTWMMRSDPLPLDVLLEYANVACLCQLHRRDDERRAVYDAMFGSDPTAQPEVDPESGASDGEEVMPRAAAVLQRRRSVAHYLTLIEANPSVPVDNGVYREALWSPPAAKSAEHALVAGEWAGLVAKDVWQESLCSIWSEFCRRGLDATRRRDGDGLSWEEIRGLVRAMASGPPTLDADTPTTELVHAIAGGTMHLADALTGDLTVTPLEDLRSATAALDTGTSGLIVLLELHRRASGRTDLGWRNAASLRSAWQPSLAFVLADLTTHLEASPTVDETLWWVVRTFILGVHERIAYSKLPEHTFRFRWEDGRVRFYDNGVGRFPLAATRNEPLALLTWDLGFWEREAGGAQLTSKGRAFIDEVFA